MRDVVCGIWYEGLRSKNRRIPSLTGFFCSILSCMRNALVVIAPQGYQDVELDGTLKGLRAAGFSISLASTEVGTCTGKFGGKQEATVAMREVSIDDYDRFAFIGGPGAAALAENPDAIALAKKIAESGKVLGAICIAPTILAAAGVLDGKRATVWDSAGEQIAFLKKHGATYSGEDVTVDGVLVTGNGPHAAMEFGQTLARL